MADVTDPMLTKLSLEMDSKPTNGEVVFNDDENIISIHRPAYTQNDMTSMYNLQWEKTPPFKQRLKHSVKKQCACSGDCWKERLLKFFPFIGIMLNYKWKEWLLLDVISGISVGVIHIPQGMGFSLLTNLPPVYGLYSSLFPVFIYFFFGTSRHISMGTMALVSLMIGGVITREVDKLGLTDTALHDNVTMTYNDTLAIQTQIDEVSISTAVSVTLLIGCFQVLMGLLGLGVVATFMSMPFISSFLTAAAVHIITSQVPSLFGLKLPGHPGMFKIPLTYYELFYHITETNICALITGLLCLVVLFILKEVINEKFRSRMKAPIPAELIVVIIVTLISYYCQLNEVYELKIVGPIPSGLPAPKVPPMKNATTYITDSLVIAVISFAISISMSKLMAKKHNYPIDVNQELYAYGIAHAFSSFFNCFAGAQAPPRTLVHDSIGGKTQVGSLVSCVLVILVCLFLGKLFVSLPISALAAIIIVALIPMFRQCLQLPRLWAVSRCDFTVWVVTFLCTVMLDVTTGLVIGMGLSVFIVVFQARSATGNTLVSISNTDVYLPKDRLISEQTFEYPGIQVFRFGAPLIFVNVEKFKTMLYEKTLMFQDLENDDIDSEVVIEINVDNEKLSLSKSMESIERIEVLTPLKIQTKSEVKLHTIVLDCAAITYIDIMGIGMLQSLFIELQIMDIRFVLAAIPPTTFKKLETAGAVSSSKDDKTMMHVYPTIQDAVTVEISRHSK